MCPEPPQAGIILQPANVRSFIHRLNADRARSRRLYTRNRTIIA